MVIDLLLEYHSDTESYSYW